MTGNLIKLSEVVGELKKNVSVSAYMREFKAAVKAGQFPAVELAERFRVPGARATKGERKAREAADFAVRNDEQFRQWHDAAVARLSVGAGRSNRGTPLAALETGQIDFDAAAERTRLRLLSAQEAAARSRAKKRSGGGETVGVEAPAPIASALTYAPAFE